MMRYIPNVLTFARIVVVPFFIIFVLKNNYLASLICFIAAGLTDFFDGLIARKFQYISDIGKIFDPLADKILVCTAFFVISIKYSHILPTWVLITVILREITVTILRECYTKKKIYIEANYFGKLKTFFQMSGIGLFLFYRAIEVDYGVANIADSVFYYYFVLTALVTVLSGLNYFTGKIGKKNEV